MTKTLTPKQEDFLEVLLGGARGNIRATMDLADIQEPPQPPKLWAH